MLENDNICALSPDKIANQLTYYHRQAWMMVWLLCIMIIYDNIAP